MASLPLVVVQVGQCGNQVGCALFDALFDEVVRSYANGEQGAALTNIVDRFFSRPERDRPVRPCDLIARAILVDTEPKVVDQCLRRRRKVPVRRPAPSHAPPTPAPRPRPPPTTLPPPSAPPPRPAVAVVRHPAPAARPSRAAAAARLQRARTSELARPKRADAPPAEPPRAPRARGPPRADRPRHEVDERTVAERAERGVVVERVEEEVVEEEGVEEGEVREEEWSWRYDEKSKYCPREGGGAGNSWARGFVSAGPKAAEAVVRLVRAWCRSDRVECPGGILLVQSAAGGTGSGVGARVAASLRAAFGDCPLLSVLVWPFRSGEVTVQPLNAILSVAYVALCADGVVVAENDQLAHVVRRLHGRAHPSMDDINVVLASRLVACLLPGTMVDVGVENSAPRDEAGGGDASDASDARWGLYSKPSRPLLPLADALSHVARPFPSSLLADPSTTARLDIALTHLETLLHRSQWPPLATPTTPTPPSPASASSATPALASAAPLHLPRPRCNLLRCRLVPETSRERAAFSAPTWHGLLRTARKMLFVGADMEEGIDWRLAPARWDAGGRELDAVMKADASVGTPAIPDPATLAAAARALALHWTSPHTPLAAPLSPSAPVRLVTRSPHFSTTSPSFSFTSSSSSSSSSSTSSPSLSASGRARAAVVWLRGARRDEVDAQSAPPASASAPWLVTATHAIAAAHPLAWLPATAGAQPSPVLLAAAPVPVAGLDRAVSLLVSCASAADPLAWAVAKAANMLRVRAFAHHFAHFGVPPEAIAAALAVTLAICRAYSVEPPPLA